MIKNIEKELIDNYTKNLQFLQKKHLNLYNLVTTLSTALETNQIKENFSLEYKNNSYFDIYDIKSKTYLYAMDSNIYKTKLTDVYDLNHNKSVIDPIIRDFDNISEIYNYSKDLLDYTVKYTSSNKQYKFISKFIFLGTFLGTHIPNILKKLSVSKCFIYEPNIEVFRLSLFTTKYYEHQDSTEFYFSIMSSEIEFEQAINNFLSSHLDLNYSIKYYAIPLYENLINKINLIVSSSQATQYHFVSSLNSYYNIAQKIIHKNKILDLAKLDDTLKDKEILILGAGPSLETNIKWVKDNQNQYIIVAVSVILKLLLQYNIQPDIIIELHSGDNNKNHIQSISNNFRDQSIFIGADHISQDVLNSFNSGFIFPTRNIFNNSDIVIKSTNVGGSALNIALLFNPKAIYLLGIDMAIRDNGIMHISSHPGIHKLNKATKNSLDGNILTKEVLFSIKGNLRAEVKTNNLFYSLLQDTQQIINNFSTNTIYNLSNGAYLKHTIPLEVETIYNSKASIDKQKIKQKLSCNFIQHSINELSNIQIVNIKKEIIELEKVIQLSLPLDYKYIKNYFIDTINNPKTDNIYTNLLINYLSIIIPYIESFLNNKAFTNQTLDNHDKNIAKLLLENIQKMTNEYKNILEKIMV